jgi:uncharacterized protein
MDLILDNPGDSLFIRSVTTDGIRVGDEIYRKPIVLNAEQVIDECSISSVEQMTEQDLDGLLSLQPDVVLIGTGATQVFLEPSQLMFFYSRNIGVEVMNTHAACRTFNVLVSELRNVAAVLIPVQSPNGNS